MHLTFLYDDTERTVAYLYGMQQSFFLSAGLLPERLLRQQYNDLKAVIAPEKTPAQTQSRISSPSLKE